MPFGAAAPAGAAVPAGAAGSARPAGKPLADVVVRRGPPGTAVVTEGPLTAAQFASYSPDPADDDRPAPNAHAGGTVRTYQRVWADRSFGVAVTDLVAAFSTPTEAAAYQKGQDAALATATAVTTAPVPGIPGAHRDAYPITSPVVGTEQVVVLVDHDVVATLSFTVAAPTATDPDARHDHRGRRRRVRRPPASAPRHRRSPRRRPIPRLRPVRRARRRLGPPGRRRRAGRRPGGRPRPSRRRVRP